MQSLEEVKRQPFSKELPPSVRRTSCIFRLDLMLDDGILSVGGRFCRSAMAEQMSQLGRILQTFHDVKGLVRTITKVCLLVEDCALDNQLNRPSGSM